MSWVQKYNRFMAVLVTLVILILMFWANFFDNQTNTVNFGGSSKLTNVVSGLGGIGAIVALHIGIWSIQYKAIVSEADP